MTPADTPDWIASVTGARVFDLGRELSPRVAHSPSHAPFMHHLQKIHGDVVDDYGMSSANDVITMGTHVGTHLDALAHVAVHGLLCGGVAAASVQDRVDGFSGGYGVDQVAPLVRRGVVADIARLLGVASLADDHLVTGKELSQALEAQAATLTPGCALFFRTGWGQQWPTAGHSKDSPGPGLDATEWALAHGVELFGSDTLVFEHMPGQGLPVHRLLLAGRGIHIIEALDLESVCRAEVWEFVLIAAPLKLRGATGSPIRPIALVSSEPPLTGG